MNKVYTGIAIVIFFLLLPSIGHTSVVGNWVVCDSCEYEYDFVAAAVTWHGEGGAKVRVSVGNPNTGEVYTMWVGGSGTVNSPLLIKKQVDDYVDTSQMRYIYIEPKTTTISASQLLNAKRNFSFISSGASEVFQDTSAEPVFRTVVAGSRNHLLFNVSSSNISNSSAFDSFISAQQEMVVISQRLWFQEDLANPGFANFAPSATTGLLNALKAYFGML